MSDADGRSKKEPLGAGVRPEDLFRVAAESLPNGVFVANSNGRIVLANHEVERQFGYGPEELIGKSVDVLLPEALRASPATHRQRSHAMPEPALTADRQELYGRRRDGSEFPVEIGLRPLE